MSNFEIIYMKNIISNTTLGIAAFLGVSNNVMAASKSVKSSAESKRMNIVMLSLIHISEPTRPY